MHAITKHSNCVIKMTTSRLAALATLCAVALSLLPAATATSPFMHGGYCPHMSYLVESQGIGHHLICGVDITNELYCWSDEGYMLANAVPSKVNKGERTDEDGAIIDVCTGHKHACILTESGSVFCWGDNSAETLGRSSSDVPHSVFPLRIDFDTSLFGNNPVAVQVECTSYDTFALMDDGDIACWGYNDPPICGTNAGTGTNTYDAIVIDITGAWSNDESVLEIHGGYYSACFSTSEDRLFCMGYDYYGSLGDPANAFTDILTPQLWHNIRDVYKVGLDRQSTCVAVYNETVGYQTYCAGDNAYGQLGRRNFYCGLVDYTDYVGDIWDCVTADTDYNDNVLSHAQPVPALDGVPIASIQGGRYVFWHLLGNGTLVGVGSLYRGRLGVFSAEEIFELEYEFQGTMPQLNYETYFLDPFYDTNLLEDDGPFYHAFGAMAVLESGAVADLLPVLEGDTGLYKDMVLSSVRQFHYFGCLIGTSSSTNYQGIFCTGQIENSMGENIYDDSWLGNFPIAFQLTEINWPCEHCPPNTVAIDGATCVPFINGPCSSDDDCTVVANTVCDTGACKCKTGYYQSTDRLSCLAVPSTANPSTFSVDVVQEDTDYHGARVTMRVGTKYACSYAETAVQSIKDDVENDILGRLTDPGFVTGIETTITCESNVLAIETELTTDGAFEARVIAYKIQGEALDLLVDTGNLVKLKLRTDLTDLSMDDIVLIFKTGDGDNFWKLAKRFLRNDQALPIGIVIPFGLLILCALCCILVVALRRRKKKDDKKNKAARDEIKI